MNENKMDKILDDVLKEMGYIIFEPEGQDYSLGDYVTDSIAFIQFMVNLEEVLGFDLTDDFFTFDVIESKVGLANKLQAFCEENDIDINKLEVVAGCFKK